MQSGLMYTGIRQQGWNRVIYVPCNRDIAGDFCVYGGYGRERSEYERETERAGKTLF